MAELSTPLREYELTKFPSANNIKEPEDEENRDQHVTGSSLPSAAMPVHTKHPIPACLPDCPMRNDKSALAATRGAGNAT